MTLDEFMGSRTAKISGSMGLGILISYLLPSSFTHWIATTFGAHHGLRALPVLLGFPIVIVFEKIYQKKREKQIIGLIQNNKMNEVSVLFDYYARVNPDFFVNILDKLQNDGYIIKE